MDLIRVGGADVDGSFVSSGPAVVAEQLPATNASKALGVQYKTAFEAANGKGSANQFGAHAFDVIVVLQKAVPIALKKGKPGTPEFRAALKDAFETMGRTPVSQGVLNWTHGRSLRLYAGDRCPAEGRERRLASRQLMPAPAPASPLPTPRGPGARRRVRRDARAV